MNESFRSRLTRYAFNLWPCYFGTGGRIRFVSADFKKVRVQISPGLRTRNYVGTIFGGSMYGCVDPIYMIMLIKNLGSEYVVWDKSATIRFKKPGKTHLYAEFDLSDSELQEIREALKDREFLDRQYRVDLKDRDGKVHCEIEKTIYIARKRPYKEETR